MSMNRYPDREGVRASSSVMDIAAALMTCKAVLLALAARQQSGKGQYVETALFHTAPIMTGFPAMQYLFGGEEPRRTGNDAPATAPSGLFRCQDRAFMLNSGNGRSSSACCATCWSAPTWPATRSCWTATRA